LAGTDSLLTAKIKIIFLSKAMLFTDYTFMGIDPTAGEKPLNYAALDHNRSLLALGQGLLDDVLAFAAGQEQAVVAVCAPRRPSQGLMHNSEFRQSLSPPPHPGRWENARLADYQLWIRNIRIMQASPDEADCPNWMKTGFVVYRRLEEMGYREYPAPGNDRQYLEVYPHACFAAMLGVLPFLKLSLEGRIQRQLVMYEIDVDLRDPMLFFEEITRHKLMKGILPTEILYKPGELDAIVAAYTAWLAITHPDQVTLVGDIDEGRIIVPGELKSRY